MATFCDINGCEQPSFRTDKLTRKHYCRNHYIFHSTDLSKLSITQKAIKKHKEELKNNPQKRKPTKAGWFDVNAAFELEVEVDNKKELWNWFEYQRTLMTGFCHNCNRPSCKNDDNRFYFSLHHILDKAHFPSVSTNKSNVLELCFWGEGSCHTRADNKILELSAMACWDEIVTKFCDMYPSIARSERRRIPEILMQYIDIEL